MQKANADSRRGCGSTGDQRSHGPCLGIQKEDYIRKAWPTGPDSSERDQDINRACDDSVALMRLVCSN
jgi:hypothetical protein